MTGIDLAVLLVEHGTQALPIVRADLLRPHDVIALEGDLHVVAAACLTNDEMVLWLDGWEAVLLDRASGVQLVAPGPA